MPHPLLADICRCLGETCPTRETCLRYTERAVNTHERTPYAAMLCSFEGNIPLETSARIPVEEAA
jgi:hypothetical protein